jgi:hypothetical protein
MFAQVTIFTLAGLLLADPAQAIVRANNLVREVPQEK